MKYSAGGSTGTIGHGLSQAPEMIITKRTDASATRPWRIGHDGLGNWDRYLGFNTNAYGTSSTIFSAAPTSTVFSIGNDPSMINETIAYCFHSVDGHQKIGTYTGTGTTGNKQTIGFRPRFLLSKRTSSASSWYIIDSTRNTTNPRNNWLNADTAAPEYNPTHGVNFEDDGFSFISTDLNGGAQTWIYLAIA